MKNILLTALTLISVGINAQNFENPSNIWVYGGLNFYQADFYVYQWKNDGEINGEPVKVLGTQRYFAMGSENPRFFGPFGDDDIYLKVNDEGVHVWDPADNDFDFLFDFEAQVGDIWMNNMWGFVGLENGEQVSITEENIVNALGNHDSNGQNFQYLEINQVNHYIEPHNSRIYHGIGPSGSFLPCMEPADLDIPAAPDQCMGRPYGLMYFTDGENTFRHNVSGFEQEFLDNVLATCDIGTANLYEFRIYPNPVSSVLKLDSFKKIDEIAVFNASGKLIRSIQNLNEEINVADLTPGLYILKGKIEGKEVNAKFIKK